MADYIGAEAMLGEMWRRTKDYLTPDYRNAYEIGPADTMLMKEGDTCTAPADGWIWYFWQNGGDPKYIVIDGGFFRISNTNASVDGSSIMLQVTKGMVLEVPTQDKYPGISASFAHSKTRLYFIPHRNASEETISIKDCDVLLSFAKGKIVTKSDGEEWDESSCSYVPAPDVNYFYGTVTPYLRVSIRNPSRRTGESIKSVEFTVAFSQLTYARHKGERQQYGRSFTRTCTVTPEDGSKTYELQLDPEEDFEFLDWRGHDDWPDGSSDEEWHINRWIGVTALVTFENGTSFTLKKEDGEHTYSTYVGSVDGYRTVFGPYIEYSRKVSV